MVLSSGVIGIVLETQDFSNKRSYINLICYLIKSHMYNSTYQITFLDVVHIKQIFKEFIEVYIKRTEYI
jgi:hypothetical protein